MGFQFDEPTIYLELLEIFLNSLSLGRALINFYLKIILKNIIKHAFRNYLFSYLSKNIRKIIIFEIK